MIIEAWKPIWAGGQIHVWELSKKLIEEHDCEIELFIMNLGGKKVEKHFNDNLTIYRVGEKTEFSSFASRIKWCFEVQKKIKEKHGKKKFDVIHAHANLPGWPAKKLSKKLGIPVVYTVHGSGLEAMKDMYGDNVKTRILYMVENYLQTKIKYDAEISVDSRFAERKNVNKPVVIPNGVDIKKYDKVKGKKSKKFKAIFVGRLHPQKGLKYLIEAVDKIKDDFKGEIHIVGGGEQEEMLKEMVKAFDIEDIVKFRGKIFGDDLIEEYKSSHLFVLPSLYEGQPLTLMEAWGAGLPVLVTDVGGNSDFVNKHNGWIVPSKDVDALASKLLKASKVERKKLKNMGDSGYKMVKQKYTWKDCAERTMEVYEDVKV